MKRLLTVLFVLCVFTPPARAVPPLYILLVPGTSLTQWKQANAPTLHSLMATGCLAVMNTRTARLPNDHYREMPESALLTLGAGSRAAGGQEVTEFDTSPFSRALYQRRMSQAPRAGFINPEWARILQENMGRGYQVRPGNLGDALQAKGIGCATDMASAAVISTALGTVPVSLSPSLFVRTYPTLSQADAALQQLVKSQPDSQVVVLSPSASDLAYRWGERLCPILVWGRGVPAGLLYSPSTRRAGLVTNTDFAPSIAHYFAAEHQLPSQPFGRAWQFTSRSQPVEFVARLEMTAYAQERGMAILPYLAALLGLGMVALTFLRRHGVVWAWAALVPPAALVALVVAPSPLVWSVSTLLFCLLGTAASRQFGVQAGVVCCLAVGLVLLIADPFLGNVLMRQHLLGYSAVEGARYYGLGNEAMGLLIASALILAGWLWTRTAKGGHWLIALALTGITLALGLPSLGAKAGGVLVATVTFSLLIWRLRGGRWYGLTFVLLLGISVIALLIVALADTLVGNGQQSHMGQALERIMHSGAAEIVNIVERKALVEGRLMVRSAWAIPLWGGLCSLAWMTRRLQDLPSRAVANAGLAAAFVTLLFNDAGVVAAAIGLLVTWSFFYADKRIGTEIMPIRSSKE